MADDTDDDAEAAGTERARERRGRWTERAEPRCADGEEWERPIDRFRRGAAGSVIAAGLLGVRDALEGRPEREEPAIVSEAPEPKLDHIDIVLDPDHPERSRAVVYLPPRDEPPERN